MALVAAAWENTDMPWTTKASSYVPDAHDLLEVVGGEHSGGIIVREGQDTGSPKAPLRLAMGSVVKVLECVDGRVLYELMDGVGPKSGWVSLSASGKALLTEIDAQVPENIEAKVASGMCKGSAEEALKWYSHRLVEARKVGEGDFIYDRKVHVAPKEAECITREGTASAELALQVKLEEKNFASATRRRNMAARYSGQPMAEDSDGEELLLCKQCSLPLGEYGYSKDGTSKCLMHGECMAELMLQDRRKEEKQRKTEQAELKKARREEYDIGWNIATIPSNKAAASKLGCAVVPQGLCCLVLEENTVRLAPTFEPAGSLNLEYLSVALQVRRVDGREPLFSLDPLDDLQNSAAEAAMQVKRFEPEWLAGTNVGEVMFQADYHLKELSMGEHEQPVIGMKSCFDISKADDLAKEWSAREWFVVRKAEIQLSEDAVLIPYLKMGVEAREQILGPDGLEDAPLTRPDHPLVKYAEAFTHNFDLIAERKSVVSQLREVAKASMIAKFMLEANVELQEQWFKLGDPKEVACCLEVPQLWNDSCFAKIQMRNGEIVTTEKARDAKVHSVYGGVDFGIDRFRLSAPSRVATSVVAGRAALGRPASTLMATSQAGLSMTPGQRFTRLAAPLSARAALTAPSRLAPPLSAKAGLAAPLSAMAAARPATSLMATSRMSMAAPQARLTTPLRASMTAPSRLAAPLSARASLAAPLSAMAGARPATSLMATSRLSVGAPGRLAAPLSAMTAARPASSLMATSRISMAAPQTATARLSMGMPRSSLMATSRISMAAPQAATSRLTMGMPRSSLMATSRISMAAPQTATSRLTMGMPRGVDLNMDKFNLSEIAHDGTWAGTVEAPAGAELVPLDGKAFWSNLQDGKVFAEEDRSLLTAVFNPQLSDRRQEGDLFVPPPTSLTYMHKLKLLVKEEADVTQKRKDHFFSRDFVVDGAGPLFPSSWTSSIGLDDGEANRRTRSAVLVPRPDLKAEESTLRDVLSSAAPVFDNCAEDGTQFLIYKLGSLEVRATRDVSSELHVGAVYAIGDIAQPQAAAGKRVAKDSERLSKATEYVERTPSGSFRYFLVLEAEEKHAVLMERLQEGGVAWREGPGEIEARTSLAKVVRVADCADPSVTVGVMRGIHTQELSKGAAKASASECKHYAQAVYRTASGQF